MKKSINQLQTPLWYGKPKYKYEVKRIDNKVVYRCVSTNKYQDGVLDELIRRYNAEFCKIRIYCNGILVRRINYKKQA